MWIAEFQSYKRFLNELIAKQPKKGRGLGQALAKHLGVEPSLITLVLKHDRDFTPEQGIRVAGYFGFDEPTTDFLIHLIHFERAHTPDLRKYYEKKLTLLRDQSEKLKNLVKEVREISEADKGTFYSNWYYSGVRMITALPEYRTVESISNYFGLSRKKVGTIVAFLVSTGLLVEEKGKIVGGPAATRIDESSEHLNNHRRNWREKAKEKFVEPTPGDYFLSAPMVISEKDAELFQKEIRELVKKFLERIPESKEETLRCLNIDWFKF